MAATPFKATIVLTDDEDDPVATYAMSASDVANAFTTNDQDSLAYVTVPGSSDETYYIDDIFLSAAGVDTTQLELWANGFASTHRLRDAALASAANVARIPRSIPVAGGTRLAFKQLA